MKDVEAMDNRSEVREFLMSRRARVTPEQAGIEYVPIDGRTNLRDLKQEAINLRRQRATGQLENPARFSQVRRQTARVLTAQNDKKCS